MSHIAREQQDLTGHKTDEADCVLIGRLAAGLHCYVPEELDETWADLRHLGRRRAQLVTAATASAQRIREFLSVAWPVVTETCAHPLESKTWLAALQVVTDRCGGDPARLAVLGLEGFTALVRQAVPGWGGQRPPPRSAAGSSRRWPTPRARWPGAAGACSAGSPPSWATWPGPGPSCGPSRRTWSRCWPSRACPGWAASPG